MLIGRPEKNKRSFFFRAEQGVAGVRRAREAALLHRGLVNSPPVRPWHALRAPLAMATPARKRAALRALSCPLRRFTLRENSPLPSSPPSAPRSAMRGALGGDARRAKARFLMHTTQPTSNLLPAGGGFLPLPSPSGGNEERPKREDAIFKRPSGHNRREAKEK